MTTQPLQVYGYPSDCPACDKLKALLELLMVPFTFYAIERESRERAILRDQGFKTVPVVFTAEGRSVGDYGTLRRAAHAGVGISIAE